MKIAARPRTLMAQVSLAALAAAASFSPALAQTVPDGEPAVIDDVIVTARKLSENLQDAPLSIQALNAAQIERLNISVFEDYVRFTPSVSFVSQGPGQSKIVIRGVAESTGAADGGGRASSGLYLDEQPITVDGSSPDPRLVDIERIEVLSGPQGTLYGASSESGTIRIITNKPDVTRFGGYLEATGSHTEFGDASGDFNGAVNLPLVQDQFAVRLTGFVVEDGGFIDNVPGTTPGGTTDNSGVAGDNFNSARTTGGRLAARFVISPEWRATASHVFQDVDVRGRSDYDPSIGDLQAVRFFNEYFSDSWTQDSLTAEGDLGFAELLVTAGLFDRKTNGLNDNTAYDQYLATTAAYYPLYDFGSDPTGFNLESTSDKRTTLEARLSSPADTANTSRWNWIVGAFYEKAEGGYLTESHVTDFANSAGFAAAQAALLLAGEPALAPTDIYFYQSARYEQEQYAVFGELSYDLTDRLTATLGGRWFDVSGSGLLHTELPYGADTTLLDAGGLPAVTAEDSSLPFSEHGFTPKLNLTYKATQDVLVYGTYSKGFRLGGANRQRLGLAVPVQYQSDSLTNYEVGLKSQWFDNRLTVNGSAFYMQWKDFFSGIRNPNPATFYFVTANVGQAEMRGLEAEVTWRPTQDWVFGGSATMLKAELSEPSAVLAGGLPKGTRLPISPEVKFAVYGEYRRYFETLDGDVYFRADYSHVGDSLNNIDPSVSTTQSSYAITNLQAGLERNDWQVNLFVKNLLDERAELFVNPNFYDSRVTSNRPREIGATLRRRF